MEIQERELAQIDVMLLVLQDARARAAQAAATLRGAGAERDVIDHVERSEKRLNQAVGELIPLTGG